MLDIYPLLFMLFEMFPNLWHLLILCQADQESGTSRLEPWVTQFPFFFGVSFYLWFTFYPWGKGTDYLVLIILFLQRPNPVLSLLSLGSSPIPPTVILMNGWYVLSYSFLGFPLYLRCRYIGILYIASRLVFLNRSHSCLYLLPFTSRRSTPSAPWMDKQDDICSTALIKGIKKPGYDEIQRSHTLTLYTRHWSDSCQPAT